MFAKPMTSSETTLVVPRPVELPPLVANSVPSGRQTIAGAEPVGYVENNHRNLNYQPPALVKHPRMAPSAVTSEQYLIAKAGSAPVFVHNVASSKIARISNLYADAPRFASQVDILA
jgi:hypothetical protein